MNQRASRWLSVAAPLALLALGVAARRHLIERWSAGLAGTPPFTLESALHFRRIEMLRAGHSLPRVDTALEYPEGVRTFASDTVGVEYPVAALARLFPDATSPETRVRWISLLWFCLGIPMMYGWIFRASGSRIAGVLAGIFYASSLGAVIRSTGWEVQRENFALPFLLTHFAAEAQAVESGRRAGRWSALSAAALAVALLCWDLIQFYLGLRLIGLVASLLRRPRGWDDTASRATLAAFAAVAAAAAAHPYYRAHGFLVSPVVTVPAVCAGLLFWKRRRGGAGAVPARGEITAAVVLALALSVLLSGAYRDSYGHFGDLLLAKLRFLNRKPADPAALNFEQRILWTPALHSTTASMALGLFPALLPLTAAAIMVVFTQLVRRGSALAVPPFVIFSHVVSGLAFALFFRFHVYAAVFGAAVLGFTAAAVLRSRRRTVTAAALGVLVVGGAVEARNTWTTDWHPAGPPPAELHELTDWLAARGAGRPVLAPFGVSGNILAYGNCPILLHPKFETPGIRRRVEEYLTELFKGTELSFRDWAEAQGAALYVHAIGELSQGKPEYRMRYMVNALQPPRTAPVWSFELVPQRMTRFAYLWGNARYRVFRIVSRADEAVAAELAARASACLEGGRVADAELLAERALRVFPGAAEAPRILSQARSLRAAGFEATPEPP